VLVASHRQAEHPKIIITPYQSSLAELVNIVEHCSNVVFVIRLFRSLSIHLWRPTPELPLNHSLNLRPYSALSAALPSMFSKPKMCLLSQ
jgi:hypothetical protein